MRKFTEEQKEILRKELSLDNKNSKYSKYICKLQNTLNTYIKDWGGDANNIHGMWPALEGLAKAVKAVTPPDLGFQIPLYKKNEPCKLAFFQDQILPGAVDEIILNHIKIRHNKHAVPKIAIDVAAIVEDINNQVNAFLRKL